jgi:hypothetical protein
MASFKTILSDIGSVLKKVFPIATTVAVDAEPIIDLAFPGFAGLYNAGVAAVVKAEGIALAVGSQSGSGTAKLSMAVQEIEPVFISWYQAQYGSTPTLTTIENWLSAVVATLNTIPAPTAASSSPTTAVAASNTAAAASVTTQAATGTLL